jgi:hypothetical protein
MRYERQARAAPEVAPGWSLPRLAGPSLLQAANGVLIGPDRRLYVAQCCGSAISAVDVDSGHIETICRFDGFAAGPDDLALIRAARCSSRTAAVSSRSTAAVGHFEPLVGASKSCCDHRREQRVRAGSGSRKGASRRHPGER